MYNESINYLLNRNVQLDDSHKVLIRGMIELTFKCYENKLIKVFQDLFETAQGCMSCISANATILSNIIAIAK